MCLLQLRGSFQVVLSLLQEVEFVFGGLLLQVSALLPCMGLGSFQAFAKGLDGKHQYGLKILVHGDILLVACDVHECSVTVLEGGCNA